MYFSTGLKIFYTLTYFKVRFWKILFYLFTFAFIEDNNLSMHKMQGQLEFNKPKPNKDMNQRKDLKEEIATLFV